MANKGRSVACSYLYHRGSIYPRGDSTVIITDNRSAIDLSVRPKGGDCGLVTAGTGPSGSAQGAQPRSSRWFGERLARRCLFGDRRRILNEGGIVESSRQGPAAPRELCKRGVEIMTLEEKEKVGGLSARQVESEHITDLGAQIMSRTLYPETVAFCEDMGSGSELCRTPLQIRLYNRGTPYSLSAIPLPLVILRTLLVGQEPLRHFHSQNTTVCSCTRLCR